MVNIQLVANTLEKMKTENIECYSMIQQFLICKSKKEKENKKEKS